MHISFAGMSNIGKSFCSRILSAHHGFVHIDCDALIEQLLAKELAVNGYTGIQGMAKWMGFPWEDRYRATSAHYVDCEKEVLKTSLSEMKKNRDTPIVLDTTGSVVYTGDDCLQTLCAATRVVYFEASEEHIAELYKTFLAYPKPVIWGESFKPRQGETSQQTLERCYPELLLDRAKRYKEIAHMVIPFEELKAHKADLGTFILRTVS